MEWVFLAGLILAFPVIAIVALVRAQSTAREMQGLAAQLRDTQRQVQLLAAKLEARPSEAAPPQQPAPATVAQPIVVEPPPQQILTPESEPVAPLAASRAAPPPPPAKDARGLEENLTSRWFVWLGAVAVALAGTFLVKYTIDEGWLGPAARTTLGFLLGMTLAAAGEWLRRRPLQRAIAALRADYIPPALTASGLFIAFASIYAAYALFGLLSPLVALLALAAVALLAVGLSLLQGRLVALMGVLGGFVTPMLIVTPSPSAWGLFAYLLVIELTALAVARLRGWWWLAFATLAGSAFWPLAWMAASWHAHDEIPLGLYLLVTAAAFFFVRRGWESPEGSGTWAQRIEKLPQPERVVWVAGLVIALILLTVVRTADYNPVALAVFGGIAALYIVAGRRESIFDALPVLMAAATLIVMAQMSLPQSVAQSLRPHAPLIPKDLVRYVTAGLAFAALFGAGGFVSLWGARRPALWAGLSAAVPVLLLTIAYGRFTYLSVDIRWAAVALALAAVGLFAAERVARHRDAPGMTEALGLYAAGTVALLSLAMTMSLREAWLTVALSIQLPLLASIHQRIPVRPLRILAALVAGIVLVRLTLNQQILSYPLTTHPAFGWVLYGYGIPALAFFAAARIFRRATSDVVVTLLEAGALAFAALLVSLEIRILVDGGLALPEYRLLEESLQSIAWLGIGSVLAWRDQRHPNPVAHYGARILLALAALQVFLLQLLAANPIFTGEFVGNWLPIDVLFLAYAIPAAFAFALSVLLDREPPLARIAAIAGFVLLFFYITLEVKHAFEGGVMHALNTTDAESYAYSIVWLVYAVVLLGLGIRFGQALLRYAALAILVVVALKVFLLDMSGLTGLYRVGSFLGLGLSLVGIGLVYQRFVFPRPISR